MKLIHNSTQGRYARCTVMLSFLYLTRDVLKSVVHWNNYVISLYMMVADIVEIHMKNKVIQVQSYMLTSNVFN
jgi:hypothetical protein